MRAKAAPLAVLLTIPWFLKPPIRSHVESGRTTYRSLLTAYCLLLTLRHLSEGLLQGRATPRENLPPGPILSFPGAKQRRFSRC
jgi:hypothetical protein